MKGKDQLMDECVKREKAAKEKEGELLASLGKSEGERLRLMDENKYLRAQIHSDSNMIKLLSMKLEGEMDDNVSKENERLKKETEQFIAWLGMFFLMVKLAQDARLWVRVGCLVSLL